MGKFAISYTRHQSFEQCPRKFHAEFVMKPPKIKFEKSQQMIDGDTDHQLLKAYALDPIAQLPARLKVCQPLIDLVRKTYKEILVEQNIAFDEKWKPVEWYAKDAWLRVQGDLIGIKGATAVIIDYKFGKVKVDADQLSLYALAIFLLYPKVKTVEAMFVFWNFNSQPSMTFERKDMKALQARVTKWGKDIDTAIETDHFPPKQSGLCRYCPLTRADCEYSDKEVAA